MKLSAVPTGDSYANPVTRLPARVLQYPKREGDENHAKTMSDLKTQQGSSVSTAIALSLLTLILGIVGGLLVSVAVNAQWKGEIEQRIKTLETQRTEDKQDLNAKYDYIRTQNEVNGKALARIEASVDKSNRR